MITPLARQPGRPRALAAFSLAFGLVVTPGASAQRALVKYDWQGKEAVIDCGVPRVGKYTLDSLAVGATWRLGSGPPSVLTTPVPLISDDAVVPPGAYRVQLSRTQAKEFDLIVEGAGRVVSSSDSVNFKGTLSDAKKPSEKLETTLAAVGEQPDKELRPLAFTVTFGVPRVTIPFTIVGSTSK